MLYEVITGQNQGDRDNDTVGDNQDQVYPEGIKSTILETSS